MYRVISAALACLVFVGCAHSNVETIDGRTDPATGNLIAMTLVYRDQEDISVQVRASYGLFVRIMGEKYLFYLYDNVAKRVYKTYDYDSFIRMFRNLPEGAEIQRFAFCGGYCWSFILSEDEIRGINSAMESGGRKWRICPVNGGEYTVVCVCETIKIRFP